MTGDSRWPDGKNESDTERDGAFSYSGEWHAFSIGVAVGFAAVFPAPKLKGFVFNVAGLSGTSRSQAIKEAKSESWYALGGVMFGAVIAVGIAGALVVLGLGVNVPVPAALL